MELLANEWFFVNNVNEIDSPALLIYAERVKENIRLAKHIAGDVEILRPHVKTSKIAEVCRMMMAEGINKFKCATIAEAEMLGLIMAKDVLLAYQPVGPKMQRLANLIKKYPGTSFSCLTDSLDHSIRLSQTAVVNHIIIHVFIDLNTGMNRSGIRPGKEALILAEDVLALPGLSLKGLHVYDGHIKDTDLAIRQLKSNDAFEKVNILSQKLFERYQTVSKIVIGGSPSFPTHVKRLNAECSPGTFIFWDHGYSSQIPEQPFIYAALVITRIISIINDHTICTDLGYKSVAAEKPIPRVFFLNATQATAVSQSEEHLVLTVQDASAYQLGDVLYGVPMHVCPTVALYERAIVIEGHQATGEWKVIARDRKINI